MCISVTCSICLCLGIMSVDELKQRLVAARGRNKQEISRLIIAIFSASNFTETIMFINVVTFLSCFLCLELGINGTLMFCGQKSATVVH